MPNKVDKRGKMLFVWNLCVSDTNPALFAASVGHSEGRSDIGWFDTITAHSLVMERLRIAGSS